MNIMFAGILGGWEMVTILVVVLILFGAKKVPELAKGLGQGIREFKKASREVTDEIQNAQEETPAQRKLPSESAKTQSTEVASSSSTTPKV